jgi:hypothetical protein
MHTEDQRYSIRTPAHLDTGQELTTCETSRRFLYRPYGHREKGRICGWEVISEPRPHTLHRRPLDSFHHSWIGNLHRISQNSKNLWGAWTIQD